MLEDYTLDTSYRIISRSLCSIKQQSHSQTMEEELHPMFKDLMERTDGWISDTNESSLDYNFLKRHPEMSVTFLIITGLAAFAGDIGNILVIGAVLSYKRLLRNPGNLFIVNLAIADLCITAIVCPMNMVGVIIGPRFYIDKVQFCNLIGSICTVSCLVSMFSIAAVAVNRVVCICKFFLYRTIYSRQRTITYCLGLWGLAILFDLPNWLGWGGHTFGLKEMGCTFDRTANYSYTIFIATMSIAVPMVIVFASYLTICLYVRHSRAVLLRVSGSPNGRIKGNIVKTSHCDRKRSTVKSEDLQMAFTLFLTFLVFVVCWSPYLIAIVADHQDTWPKEVYVVGTLLGHSNSCLNMIIYAMSNKRFRQGYYVFIHKIFCMKITRESILKDSNNKGGYVKYTSRYSRQTVNAITPPSSRRVLLT